MRKTVYANLKATGENRGLPRDSFENIGRQETSSTYGDGKVSVIRSVQKVSEGKALGDALLKINMRLRGGEMRLGAETFPDVTPDPSKVTFQRKTIKR